MAAQGISLARDASGQMRIRRRYGFEFTSDGERRYFVVMGCELLVQAI